MTKFIELTTNEAKLTINAHNIMQFMSMEPNDVGLKTKMAISDGAECKEIFVLESYDDILRALEVKRIFSNPNHKYTYEIHATDAEWIERDM